MTTNKYTFTLPTKNGDKFYYDLGTNEELAHKLATAYFDADEEGWIELIYEDPETHEFYLNLPNSKILQEPANCEENWLTINKYKTWKEALETARKYGANEKGRIKIVDEDFIE